MKKILTLILLYLLTSAAFPATKPPKLFLFMGGEEVGKLERYRSILKNPYVSGVQIVYPWDKLEPRKNHYNFSLIARDLKYLTSIHKKLFVQLQDRSFKLDQFVVPDYLRREKQYHGGVAMQYDFPGQGVPISTGWVARVWDPSIRKRFQKLITKLAEEFDGKIYGVSLPETAVDFDENNLPEGFSPNVYFSGEIDNLLYTKNQFHQSLVIQYVNFFPGEWCNDHHYMSSLFSFAINHKIGLGGPDIVPYRDGHMKNDYPYFHQYHDRLLFVAMAIQEPDYTYTNPRTGKPYTFQEFYSFSGGYLGASMIFWNVQEPFFSKDLIPRLNADYFEKS